MNVLTIYSLCASISARATRTYIGRVDARLFHRFPFNCIRFPVDAISRSSLFSIDRSKNRGYRKRTFKKYASFKLDNSFL